MLSSLEDEKRASLASLCGCNITASPKKVSYSNSHIPPVSKKGETHNAHNNMRTHVNLFFFFNFS